jgi:hypothetical protein
MPARPILSNRANIGISTAYGPFLDEELAMSDHTSKMPNKKAAKISSADNLLKTSKKGDVELDEKQLGHVSGGKPQKADGSLDVGIHFKYDIKGNKEG